MLGNNLIKVVFALALCAASTGFASRVNGRHIPESPQISMTPGSLCSNSDTYRYPEKIKYCERDVSSSLKRQIIDQYDKVFGFEISKMPREDFKIDHFIPLSIGGSNEISNLWPQHKSVYHYSDPLESDVFNLISAGKIKQAEAIRVIKECKMNLDRCEELGHYLKKLF